MPFLKILHFLGTSMQSGHCRWDVNGIRRVPMETVLIIVPISTPMCRVSWHLIQDSIVTNLVDYDDDEREVSSPHVHCSGSERMYMARIHKKSLQGSRGTTANNSFLLCAVLCHGVKSHLRPQLD